MYKSENWKPITGYDGLYEVSNLGRVRSIARPSTRGGILSHGQNRCGYSHVVLCKDGVCKPSLVSRLVAIAFIPNPKGKPYVGRRNKIKTDNGVKNLKWITPEERQGGSVAKKVLQLKDGKVIKEWESAREAERHGFDSSCISLCCNGKHKTHRKFQWKFANNLIHV